MIGCPNNNVAGEKALEPWALLYKQKEQLVYVSHLSDVSIANAQRIVMKVKFSRSTYPFELVWYTDVYTCLALRIPII